MIAAAVCVAGLASCFHGSGEPEEEADRMILMLRMMPVDADPVTSDSGVKEMIRSIRIILLSYGGGEEDNGNSGNNGNGEKGIIEYNQRIVFENPSAVSRFRYDFAWPTFAGKKSLYIVANEESVTKGVRFLPSDGGTLPDLSDSESLTDLLDGYEAVGKDHLADPAAQESCAELVRVLDAVAFKPVYTVDDDEVFLPYVSYYSAAENEKFNIKKGDYIDAEAPFYLYLVPVATKFTFHFENYRPHAVEINDITLSSAHSENFLMARVGEADYEKPFGRVSPDENTWQDYYWIDWLAKVSEASHKHSGADDNRDFNAKYGWISHYAIPDGNTPERKTFVQKTDQQRVAQAEVVPGDETDGIPSTLTLGPFYLPESRNIARKSQNNIGAETGSQETDSQKYYLTLGLHDVTHQSSEYDPKFEEQPIDNLEALFRNTHVKINVVLRQGNVRVYAEIADWSRKSANGWVAEGPEPEK